VASGRIAGDHMAVDGSRVGLQNAFYLENIDLPFSAVGCVESEKDGRDLDPGLPSI
jgi:hypothetical protein